MLSFKMGRHQIFSLLCFLLFSHPCLPFASPLCPLDQRDALLLFKNSFVLQSTVSNFICDSWAGVTSYPKTKSWNKGKDCCLWDGVTCDDVNGNIIGLDLTCSWLQGALHSNSSLFLLHHLRSLNLSGNDFVGSGIPPNLSAFAEMTHLNLSRSQFGGAIPNEISHLSNLVSLDLSLNYYSLSPLMFENSVFMKLVQNLTIVRKLVLEEVDMSRIPLIAFANLSSSLTHLSVASCSLGGTFPVAVFHLPSLTVIDINFNYGVSGILPRANWTGPLVSLSLFETSFSGEIPSSMADLKQLQVVEIFNSNFSGPVEFEIFSKLENLHKLFLGQELNLSYNRLDYTFPKLEVLRLPYCNLIGFPYFLNSLTRLTYLDLASNRLSEEIPRWFWGVGHDTLDELDLSDNLLGGRIQQLPWKRLSYINLEKNSFQGPLPIPPPSIVFFTASDNNFTGEIPSSICRLRSLQQLYLSNNSLSGDMPQCFCNKTSLTFLDLSTNKFQGSLPRSLAKCVNLSVLNLGHNGFSDIFPHWLEAPRLLSFDLRSNKFYGRINLTSFGLSFPALESLFISSNNFSGRWPTEFFSNTSLYAVDLSDNDFEGSIPLTSPVTYFYSVAGNRMTGKIPSSLCNATELEIINLSYNGFTGDLPPCLTNVSIGLSVLNLRGNHLDGTIPQPSCSRNRLTTLDLSQNLFEGTLPRSFVKCEYLEVLDLNDNRIEDTFPKWLGTLPELQVLILRSNNLMGLLNIPEGAHLFPKLRILDLSNNNFGGTVPSNLIINLEAMMTGEDGLDKSLYMERSFDRLWRRTSYENSMTVTIKGKEITQVKILTIITIIDLSCNSFQGDIPEVIGHLHNLKGLNLSHNYFTGSIPVSLENLTNLEWLDLSSNKLSGGIPKVLGDLTYLGYLDLSRNQLLGRIPQDKQLSTFSSESFSDNSGLCGTPLPKACPGDAQSPPPSSSSSFDREIHESWFNPKALLMGYASGIVIGISVSYIVVETRRPKWLARCVRMLERSVTKWMKKPRPAIKFYGQ